MMLGARINVIQHKISNLIVYLLPDKKKQKRQQLWLNEIKRVDWTETIVRDDRLCNARFLSEKIQ